VVGLLGWLRLAKFGVSVCDYAGLASDVVDVVVSGYVVSSEFEDAGEGVADCGVACLPDVDWVQGVDACVFHDDFFGAGLF
jgi:hypothetical protein